MTSSGWWSGAGPAFARLCLSVVSALSAAVFVLLAGGLLREFVHATGHVFTGHTVLIDAFNWSSSLPLALAFLSLLYIVGLSAARVGGLRKLLKFGSAPATRRVTLAVWVGFSAAYMLAFMAFWMLDPSARAIRVSRASVLRGVTLWLIVLWPVGWALGYLHLRTRKPLWGAAFCSAPLLGLLLLLRALSFYSAQNYSVPYTLLRWQRYWWVWVVATAGICVAAVRFARRRGLQGRRELLVSGFQAAGLFSFALLNCLALSCVLPVHHLCTLPDHPEEARVIALTCAAVGMILFVELARNLRPVSPAQTPDE